MCGTCLLLKHGDKPKAFKNYNVYILHSASLFKVRIRAQTLNLFYTCAVSWTSVTLRRQTAARRAWLEDLLLIQLAVSQRAPSGAPWGAALRTPHGVPVTPATERETEWTVLQMRRDSERKGGEVERREGERAGWQRNINIRAAAAQLVKQPSMNHTASGSIPSPGCLAWVRHWASSCSLCLWLL